MGKERLSLPLLVLVLVGITLTQAGAQQTCVISVFPESYTVPDVGLNFSVNITVQNVVDLYGWALTLYYPSDILNGTSVVEGLFLKAEDVFTFFLLSEFTDAYNETHGRINALCTRTEESVPGVNGSGVLATITFRSKSTNGPKVLHLADIELSDSQVEAIPYSTVDGEVRVVPEFPVPLILFVLTTSVIVFRKVVGSRKFRVSLPKS